MSAGVVVVGAGYGAGELAAKLRQGGYAGPITLVGAETHLPYHRPPLSKAFLAGETDEAALLLRPAAFYEKHGITVLLGRRVNAIDRAGHSVSLDDAKTLAYEKLVLATGGEARRLTCPGADLVGVYTLRGIDDVLAIRSELRAGQRVAIIGAGYIGLEVAAVARKHGLEVTVLEAAPRVLARVAGPEISAFYTQAHTQAGVAIRTSAMVAAILPSEADPGRAGAVQLQDGTAIAADWVLAGIGLVPGTQLAEAAGLKVENGIWVDAFCSTEDPDILAIGDCANHPLPFAGHRVRLESVPNALEQARVAADTICGKQAPYAAVPWFWSDQYDLKLQAVGLADGHDAVVMRGNPAERNFLAFYLRGGVPIAADAVNRPGEFMMARRLVAAGKALNAADLGNVEKPLKELL